MPPDIERTYVDLIFRGSKKYAAWDPEVPIQVGDYGRITKGRPPKWPLGLGKKNNGTFMRDGNIYSEGIAAEYDIPDSIENGVQSDEGVSWVTSKNAQQVDFGIEGSGRVHAPGAFATLRAKAAFSFKEGRGALLAMENETIISIPYAGKLRRLLDSPRIEKGSVIVSEVHHTSSYIRYLSSRESETIAVGLSAEAPAANVASVGTNMKWIHSATSGNFKTKTSSDGKRIFNPLYRLVALEDNGPVTGLRGDMGEDPPLPDAEPPWDSDWNHIMETPKKHRFPCMDTLRYFLF